MRVDVPFLSPDPYRGAPEGYIRTQNGTLFKLEGKEGTYDKEKELIDKILLIEGIKPEDKSLIVMSRL